MILSVINAGVNGLVEYPILFTVPILNANQNSGLNLSEQDTLLFVNGVDKNGTAINPILEDVAFVFPIYGIKGDKIKPSSSYKV